MAHGLVPGTHGRTGRTAPNALVLEDVKGIITFVMHYVESNGVLPGRVPGYKRDDIKLLPSNCTKQAVWMLYQDSTSTLSLQSFCKVWRHFLADVVVCKPMTDLCAICQKTMQPFYVPAIHLRCVQVHVCRRNMHTSQIQVAPKAAHLFFEK